MSGFIKVAQGNSPLVLGLPHTGTDVPPDVWATLNDNGRKLADTDWHIDRLYADLVPDVTTVRTAIHRYVIDVNRDPGGVSLYPGQNTTELCPTTDFDGQGIYRLGRKPGEEEIRHRLETCHRPYHDALLGELQRVKQIHGFAILYDCHSIRSDIPFLFKGTLPDFNIGTSEGVTCDPEVQQIVLQECQAATEYSHILNGRFKGGWTTRAYGRPDDQVHTIQMELAQSTYLATEAPPWAYDPTKAARLRETLAKILKRLCDWRPHD